MVAEKRNRGKHKFSKRKAKEYQNIAVAYLFNSTLLKYHFYTIIIKLQYWRQTHTCQLSKIKNQEIFV
jgi:hypothetical protein